MIRAPRTILVGLATLALGAAGLAGQAGVAYAAESEPSLLNVSSSAVTQTSVILNATIDTGNAETTYRFEFGTSAAYGTSVPVPDANIGTGTEGRAVVGQQLTGLQPDTTYHFRVLAENKLGHVLSEDHTVTTLPPLPPIVSTGQAVGVAQNSAMLTGTVDTQGYQTMYEFDIGVDTGYGSRLFANAGVEPGPQTFAFPLQGLAPGTTYHYRIAATNIFGTTYGVDETFTTPTYPSALLSEPVTPSLLPAILLAPAPSSPAGAAKAASVKPAAHAARHTKAGKASKQRGRRKEKGGSGRAGRAHGANRGGGR